MAIDRGDYFYFQCAYLIRKGADLTLRAEGVEAFQRRIGASASWLVDRMTAVTSLHEVKLLNA